MFRFWYRILDDDGDTSTATLNFPDSFTLAQVQSFAASFIPLVDAVINGSIQEAGITVSVTLPGGIKLIPDDNCDVQYGALYSMRTVGNYSTSFRLPTFIASKMASNSKNVDVEDVDVAAFVDAVVDGVDVSGTMIQPSDYRGDDITALVKAVESFRK